MFVIYFSIAISASSPHLPSGPVLQDFLVGDSQGAVFELEINNLNERSAKKVFAMPGDHAPITALHMDIMGGLRGNPKMFIMVANPR